jgi:hypothetical protein
LNKAFGAARRRRRSPRFSRMASRLQSLRAHKQSSGEIAMKKQVGKKNAAGKPLTLSGKSLSKVAGAGNGQSSLDYERRHKAAEMAPYLMGMNPNHLPASGLSQRQANAIFGPTPPNNAKKYTSDPKPKPLKRHNSI